MSGRTERLARTIRPAQPAQRALALAIVVVCASFSGVSQGAGSKQAQTLLRDGKRLMAANRIDDACPKLAKSQELAPSPETLVQLAICHEREGKHATAYRELNLVLQQATGKDPALALARKQLPIVQNKVAQVTIKIPDLPETRSWSVSLDGMPLESSAWNVAQPVDPGSHKVSVSGMEKPWSKMFTIGKGAEVKTIEVPVRQQSVSEAAKTTGKEARLEDPSQVDRTTPSGDVGSTKEQASGGGGASVAGWILGGAGIVAIGVGSYFGVRAISLRKDSDKACVNGCTASGVDSNNQAKTAAWVSDFAIGGGILMAGVGTYLLLRSSGDEQGEKRDEKSGPSETGVSSVRVVPAFSPTTAGLTLGGVW